jgi:hypothetical protein
MACKLSSCTLSEIILLSCINDLLATMHRGHVLQRACDPTRGKVADFPASVIDVQRPALVLHHKGAAAESHSGYGVLAA